jgi:hypothetical protein
MNMSRPVWAGAVASVLLFCACHVSAQSFTSAAGAAPIGSAQPIRPMGGTCGSVVLTQSSSQSITPLNSVSCNSKGVHTDNSYFRAFQVTQALDVCEVQFGVESAVGLKGGQEVIVRLYTSNQPFPAGFPGSLTQIGDVSAFVRDTDSGTVVSVPITASVPAGSQLVAEIFTPGNSVPTAPTGGTGASFFIGSNTAAESGPGYIFAPDCSINAPTTTTDIGFPNMHIVLNVSGDPAGEPAPAVSLPTLSQWALILLAGLLGLLAVTAGLRRGNRI